MKRLFRNYLLIIKIISNNGALNPKQSFDIFYFCEYDRKKIILILIYLFN